MANLVVVFRTQSDVEASLVKGLLESNGVMTVVSSDVTHSVFPLTINALGEVRIAVDDSEAERAQELIQGHQAGIEQEGVEASGTTLDALEQAMGYRFRDRGLLEHAMTHTSHANEDASLGATDNESLEFLGDAVLGFIVADLLFHEFPASDEGQKSKIKASLVSTPTLAQHADGLGLGDHLLLGRGEEKTGGRRKQALLADAYEALIAAVYLDGGVEVVRNFVSRQFASLIADVRSHGLAAQDHKSMLQEYLQSRDRPLPEYRLIGTIGPDHRKRFHVEAVIGGEPLAEGAGSSKKEAEQEAAMLALQKLRGTQ